MPWGSYLHTGHVDLKVKGKPIDGNVRGWRDASGSSTRGFDEAGQQNVRAKIKDLVIIRSRPTTPPPSHLETPSA